MVWDFTESRMEGILKSMCIRWFVTYLLVLRQPVLCSDMSEVSLWNGYVVVLSPRSLFSVILFFVENEEFFLVKGRCVDWPPSLFLLFFLCNVTMSAVCRKWCQGMVSVVFSYWMGVLYICRKSNTRFVKTRLFISGEVILFDFLNEKPVFKG